MKTTGFTLLELLVSITILMVITGGLLTSYNAFNDKRRVKETAVTLKTDLRFAQNKAISAMKPSSNCTVLKGYKLTFTLTTYIVQPTCTGSGTPGPLLTTTLPTGITFSPIPDTFTFGVLTQGITSTPSITITLVGLTTSYRLLIAPNGDITDLGYL